MTIICAWTLGDLILLTKDSLPRMTFRIGRAVRTFNTGSGGFARRNPDFSDYPRCGRLLQGEACGAVIDQLHHLNGLHLGAQYPFM